MSAPLDDLVEALDNLIQITEGIQRPMHVDAARDTLVGALAVYRHTYSAPVVEAVELDAKGLERAAREYHFFRGGGGTTPWESLAGHVQTDRIQTAQAIIEAYLGTRK